MAITLTYNFSSGASRDGSEVQQNIEDVRDWLGGKGAIADMAAGAASYKCILRPEHYGNPLRASLGVSGDTYGDSAGMQKNDRECFKHEIAGSDFIPCANVSRTVHLERASLIVVSLRYYAWAAFDADITPGNDVLGVVAYTRLFVGDTGAVHTTRRISIEDNGPSSPGLTDKREHSVFHMESLAAGYHDVWLGVNPLDHGYASATDPIDDTVNVSFSYVAGPPVQSNFAKRIDVESRSLVIAIHPFAA